MLANPLIELQFAPPIAYFQLLARHEAVMIEQQENYSKGSYRNRCHIAGPNGVQRLSIPLASGKHQQKPIREVNMSFATDWPSQHWRSLTTAYGRAPFFDHYADHLRPFWQQTPTSLFEFNMGLLKKLTELVGLETTFHFTENYQPISAEPETLDYRNRVHPKQESPFPLPRYPQLFLEKNGFLPNLSILDLLFCTGPQSIQYLTV